MSEGMEVIRTLRVRVKDKHAAVLRKMSAEVNTVWNYCNELSQRQIRERGKFMSGYDFDPYLKGATEHFSVGANTILEVGHIYAVKRRQAKRARLKWRRSYGSRRSLGWVPFRKESSKWRNGQVRFAGHNFGVWDSYGLSDYEFRAGSFSEDSRGRWYFCVAVRFKVEAGIGKEVVGIDLGLKTSATCSDGTQIDGRWFRQLESKLAVAQRSKNKARTRAIHAKIANRRKDAMHKKSTELVKRCSHIYVGNVSGLTQTKMAKSVYDAGWSSFKTMLEYKSQQAGIVYREINEAHTTQTCSSCGEIPDSSPKGRAGLGIRDWICDGCGVHHDRDVNAARNILSLGLGHEPPVEGIAAYKHGCQA